MFRSVLHDAIRQYRSFQEIRNIIQSSPSELDKLDHKTQMTVVQHAAFRGRPDVILCAMSMESKPDTIVKKLNTHQTLLADNVDDEEEDEDGNILLTLAEKSPLLLASEQDHHFTVVTLRLLGAQFKDQTLNNTKFDIDILLGLLYWVVTQSDNTAMLSLLGKHLALADDKSNAKTKSKNPTDDAKATLLHHVITIDSAFTKPIIDSKSLASDLHGLSELAAQQEHSKAAIELFTINNMTYRYSDTVTSVTQWAAIHELLPLINVINDDNNDLSLIVTPISCSDLSGTQKKIYDLAKAGKSDGLDRFQNPKDSKTDSNSEADHENDYLAVLKHAYQARDFVALEAMIKFYEKRNRLLDLFHFALNEKNRNLFFILMFATNQYPADLAPYFAERLNDFLMLLNVPSEKSEKMGILSRVIAEGTHQGHRETRDYARVELHKKLLKAAKVSSDEWISIYFRAQPIYQTFSRIIRNEQTAVQELQTRNLLNKSIAIDLYEDAMRFGVKLTHHAFLQHIIKSEEKFTSAEKFFRKTNAPAPTTLVIDCLQSQDRGRFGCVSKNCYTLTLSLKVFVLNQFLDHLNQCVMEFGLKRRIANLPWKQKLLLFSYFPILAGAIATTTIMSMSLSTRVNLLDNLPRNCDVDDTGALCTAGSSTLADCVDDCKQLSSLSRQIAASSILLSLSYLLFIGLNIIGFKRSNGNEAIFTTIYRALFNDLSNKPIGFFSPDLPLRAEILLKEFKIDPEALTSASTVHEFRTILKDMRPTLLMLEAKQRMFAPKTTKHTDQTTAQTSDNKDNKHVTSKDSKTHDPRTPGRL